MSRFLARTAPLVAALFLSSTGMTAAEPGVFHPAYAPAPADNPLKGFVPYAGQGRAFPHSLEFNYLPLASLMTGPTNFNWTPMEQLLDGIAALGARYDGDPRIGFITAGLLGTWGEWHCYPHSEWFASKTVQAEVMDAYEAAFHKTPVLLRYPAGDDDYAHAPNGRRNMGYHDDSFAWATLETGRKEDDWFYLAALRQAGPAAMERWKTAPIGGEIRPELWPCLWKKDGCMEGQDFDRCVRETHATWLMDSSTSRPLAPDEKERALAAARSLGYELQVVQATAALKGRALEVSVTLTNRGVAPFYANWPVQILAVGSDGAESAAQLPFALNTLLPATAGTQSATLDLAKFPSGGVHLLLGIPNPLKTGRPLRFANADAEPTRAGWLTLGKIVIP